MTTWRALPTLASCCTSKAGGGAGVVGFAAGGGAGFCVGVGAGVVRVADGACAGDAVGLGVAAAGDELASAGGDAATGQYGTGQGAQAGLPTAAVGPLSAAESQPPATGNP